MNNTALITNFAAVYESSWVLISCIPYVLARNNSKSFTYFFSKSVSQFGNVLIVSQMLIIDKTLSHTMVTEAKINISAMVAILRFLLFGSNLYCRHNSLKY